MPLMSSIDVHFIAIDLRVDLVTAAHLRADAAAWSLWPDAPFGASADAGVWPSVFVPEAEAAPDRIALRDGEAPFWQAFGLWDDLREMAHHMRPLPIDTVVMALALEHGDARRTPQRAALGQLAMGGLSTETLDSDVALLGYDITDAYLQTALFDAARPELDADDVPRTDHGLIDGLDAAQALLPRLEKDDPAHAPLFAVSVWSLGQRDATPDA